MTTYKITDFIGNTPLIKLDYFSELANAIF